VSSNGKQFVTWSNSKTGKLAKGRKEPANVAMVGNVFNCDSFGYNSKIIKKQPGQMSWGELLNPTWKGRVALLNDPNIGLQDAGIAAEAVSGDSAPVVAAIIDRHLQPAEHAPYLRLLTRGAEEASAQEQAANPRSRRSTA